jgi:hypothetical protein
MYKHIFIESHDDGSQFFIKTPTGCVIRVSLTKPDQDYISEYLEDKVRHLIVKKCNTLSMNFVETREMCETIAKIVYDFISHQSCVVKAEVDTVSNKNSHMKRVLSIRPVSIKGFVKENVDGNDLYFLFNSDMIDGTDLLSSLIDEYDN